jgi:hypothetical protein
MQSQGLQQVFEVHLGDHTSQHDDRQMLFRHSDI